MAGDVDSFPPVIQYLIYFCGGVGVIASWLLGGRRKGGETVNERDVRLTAIEEGLAKIERERERDQTDRDMAALRREIETGVQQVVKAFRESTDAQFKEMNRQIVGLRQHVGRLSRKQPK
jgi:hypothetical protein